MSLVYEKKTQVHYRQQIFPHDLVQSQFRVTNHRPLNFHRYCVGDLILLQI